MKHQNALMLSLKAIRQAVSTVRKVVKSTESRKAPFTIRKTQILSRKWRHLGHGSYTIIQMVGHTHIDFQATPIG